MKGWEPQAKESMPAYAAFAEYRDLGPERSIEAVSRKLSKSIPLLKRWSSRWSWVQRAKGYDAHLDSIRIAAREQSVAKQARKIMTADEVLQGLTSIADSDIAEIFEDDGTFDLAKAKERGASKRIKSLSFDKDTGRVVKVEAYSAHEGLRDMGKTHRLFIDKVETEDKTEKDPVTLFMSSINEASKSVPGFVPITYEQAQKIMDAATQRAKLKAVS